MNRLKQTFEHAQIRGEKLLSIFITAGFPHLESTADLIWNIEEAGADFVEIGIPFSDPIADGPTIQKTSQAALENSITVGKILQQVQTIRQKSEIPIILMSYLNPLLKYDFKKFANDAEKAGVDGLIIPDLIPEEFQNFAPILKENGLGLNFLVSPNTSFARIRLIDRLTSDFIYCVSVAGITGSREGVPDGLIAFLTKLDVEITHPYLVGFGVSNANDAKAISKHCDGVIIGSAILDLISNSRQNEEMLNSVRQFVQEIKLSLKGD